MRFRKAWVGQPLSAGERVRQGEVVKAAVAILGGAEARIFLNDHHAGLGGRPLDLAIASDAGLEAVRVVLGAEALRAGEPSSGMPVEQENDDVQLR